MEKKQRINSGKKAVQLCFFSICTWRPFAYLCFKNSVTLLRKMHKGHIVPQEQHKATRTQANIFCYRQQIFQQVRPLTYFLWTHV
jgi:hypothetical protein